ETGNKLPISIRSKRSDYYKRLTKCLASGGVSEATPASKRLRLRHRILLAGVLGEFLVKRIAIHAQAGGGLHLDVIAKDKDLFDQFSLDGADDTVFKRAFGERLDADADQLLDQARKVVAAVFACAKPTFAAAGPTEDGRRQFLVVPQHHAAFDQVFQLADIA